MSVRRRSFVVTRLGSGRRGGNAVAILVVALTNPVVALAGVAARPAFPAQQPDAQSAGMGGAGVRRPGGGAVPADGDHPGLGAAGGRPQRRDPRWPGPFQEGRRLARGGPDAAADRAPERPVVRRRHDRLRRAGAGQGRDRDDSVGMLWTGSAIAARES